MRKKVLFLMLLLMIPAWLYAEESTPVVVVKEAEYLTFSDWLNARPYTVYIDEKEERKTLREKWRQALGIDIFYAYFKAQEIKHNVENKSEIKVLRLKGKARIKEDEAKFIFSIKF